ncbi:hypothetical protein GCM10010218_33610 [Streptomyces mashuensis]|uniref:Cell division initiation protein n=1 Tax=Streptomyces mashuensis TaxID=33904 RepID=A0A919B533_9ACTN|nr:cell division initiation protein [Streptomyces mashuensis]GHF49567.1 hypothetical protein GCM10010218_33610 [Streptomyces mashuensis]
MDVHQKLDEIVSAVAGARALPMSASCVLNRAALLARLEELRAALPGSLAEAREVLGDRDRLVADARQEAERVLEAARAERAALVSGTEVARRADEEAGRILAEARREAETVRAGADDYADAKLAHLEVVLTKAAAAAGGPPETGSGAAPEPDSGGVPDGVAGVRALLADTLAEVARGREKLRGALPADGLSAGDDGPADADGAPVAHTDADFLAGLAAPEEPLTPSAAPGASQEPQASPEPLQPAWEPAHAAAEPLTAYARQEHPEPYGEQAGAGFAYQADPYAVPGTWSQPDPYAWPPPQDAGGPAAPDPAEPAAADPAPPGRGRHRGAADPGAATGYGQGS